MSERKYYCFCADNCKFETMTKEQILAAIAQAAADGLVFDADAAFITKVKEGNAGDYVTFWAGTQAQYNALGNIDPYCLYIITDSTEGADLAKAAEAAQAAIDEHAANKENPHEVTAAQVGAAAEEHEHSANDITSGTLSIARGGTGRATHTSNAVLTGNGTSAVKNVAAANGAFYATAANGAPKFGTLPIAQGGTGATTAADALKKLGLTATAAELNYMDGATGNVQAQLDGKVTITKLWENASPASSFAAQTISVSVAGYDFFIVRSRNGSGNNYNSAIVFPSVTHRLTMVTTNCYYREITFNSTGNNVTFGNCSLYEDYGSTNGITKNDAVIPYEIYGIKGVTA